MNSTLLNNDKEKYFVHPGYIFVSREPHLLSTVLGSCVSVCIWDTVLKFGGMNHYVHSKPFRNEKTAHYGTISIPYMLNLMVKLGSSRSNLMAHIVGGAQNSEMGSLLIGKQNIEIAEKIIRENFIQIVTFDTGGKMGRKVVFDTENGEIVVYKVNNLREYDWYGDKSINNR